jgi:purine nucleosidase
MERASSRRVVINTDAKNEADDQFAIVHALLSPPLDVRGLIAAHFGTSRSDRSMEDSREEIDLLLNPMQLHQRVTVANGAPTGIPDEQTPLDSEGAQLIIAESKLAASNDPLYVAFLGPLTDMASAILLDLCPARGIPSASSSPSTSGSCLKTCSPRSASSAGTRPELPAQPFSAPNL